MADSVLIDHRYYRIKPGMVPAHLDLYEQTGFAAQTRYLGQPFAYLFTEPGEVNTLVHMWLYDDVADRAKKRAAIGRSGMAKLPAPQQRGGLRGVAAEQFDATGEVRPAQALTLRLQAMPREWIARPRYRPHRGRAFRHPDDRR